MWASYQNADSPRWSVAASSPLVGDSFIVRVTNDSARRLGGVISSEPMPNAGGVPKFLRWDERAGLPFSGITGVRWLA